MNYLLKPQMNPIAQLLFGMACIAYGKEFLSFWAFLMACAAVGLTQGMMSILQEKFND